MSNNLSMPTDWMDQMIDVISSGVRRPFMTEQSLDWSSIPTTSTRTPRVTPRTTNSSSTSNPPSQGNFETTQSVLVFFFPKGIVKILSTF